MPERRAGNIETPWSGILVISGAIDRLAIEINVTTQEKTTLAVKDR